MDGQLCRRFFLDPQLTFHRRYEALRRFSRRSPRGRDCLAVRLQANCPQCDDQSVSLPVSAEGAFPPFLSPTVEGDLPVNGSVKT